MRVVSTIDSLAEVEALLEAGVDELYGGCLPEAWEKRFSLLASLNQRTFAGAQIDSLAELGEIVGRTHDRGRRLLITLNAPFYNDAQGPLLQDFVADCADAGVDGIILADLGLLRWLRSNFPNLEYHASTLAHLGNSAAVRFYLKQGVTSVILPRHLTVAELAAVVEGVPGVRCDAFLLVGKCPNSEGLCTHHHASPDKLWPCEIPYEIQALEADSSPQLQAAMLRQGSWSHSNRRHGCGLCAIPSLIKAGIGGVKLVGRGAPTAQKVRNLLLVNDFLALAAEELDFSDYRRRARAAHRDRFGSPCSPNVCYYPEYYQED